MLPMVRIRFPRALLFILSLLAGACCPARPEEVPLENCDRLPVVWASISGMRFLFLVDTAATSMLNLKSFAHGDSRRLAVSSWSGTAEIDGQDVIVGDLAIGRQHVRGIHLHAVDLSAIGRACGRRIDGILGIDLLGKLGATVDLKNHVARLPLDSVDAEARFAELHQQLVECEKSFNRRDEAAFADCLDPQIVLFAAGGNYDGRDAAMRYYRDRYFRRQPAPELSITPRGYRQIGDAIWVEYDLRLMLDGRPLNARASALCVKHDGRWRIVHMNHSTLIDGTAPEE